MNRALACALCMVVLAGAALWLVRIDTDVRAMLGEGAPAVQFLDQPEGRSVTILVKGDGTAPEDLARSLAARLMDDPLVEDVLSPQPDTDALVDFLWTHRFALAPPSADALDVDSMSRELAAARAALTGMGSSALAGRYMLDPTGSFRRLVEHLGSTELFPAPRQSDTALVLLRLTDVPFDVATQQRFADRVRGAAAKIGADVLILGPRAVSARVSDHIAGRSVWTMGLGILLLLVWLGWALRSARGVAAAMLPLALGFAAACLAVQTVFGAVHVLALGFGGALLGLALDYPIHLMSHSGVDRAHAIRCVRLGAATTAVAFGSLVTAGLPALAQVGVFVAAGLLVSAAASVWMGLTLPSARFLPGSGTRGFHIPGRPWILAGTLCIALTGLSMLPERPARALVTPPPDVTADMAKLGEVLDLPSGRFAIEVSGRDLSQVRSAQGRLSPVLERLVQNGHLRRASMLTDHLPEAPRQADLPQVESSQAETVAAQFAEALINAGLDSGFAARIERAHVQALAAAQSVPETIPGLAAALIRPGPDGLIAPVQLWDVSDPEALSKAVMDLSDPRIRLVDRQGWIADGIALIRTNTLWAIGGGMVVAMGILTITTGRAAIAIALATATATAIAALAAGAMFQGLGVFQIMALVLVMGIGIDYGLLVTPGHDNDGSSGAYGRSLGSVLLCAGSTVAAFGVMAFSGVGVLAEIGTTVVIGVLAMVFMALWRAEGRG